jgi:hypothetical protein
MFQGHDKAFLAASQTVQVQIMKDFRTPHVRHFNDLPWGGD